MSHSRVSSNKTDDGSDDSRGPPDLISRTQEGTSGGAGDPLREGHCGVRLQRVAQDVQPCVGSELSSAALGVVRVDDPCCGPQRETAVRSLRWEMDDMIVVCHTQRWSESSVTAVQYINQFMTQSIHRSNSQSIYR